MVQAVLLDVDGTLVDSNYQNVLAWTRAFASVGVTAESWRIHRAQGQGGDRLVSVVAGEDVEKQHGDDVRAAWREEYERLIEEVRPLPAAHDLVAELHRRGFVVVLASSSPPEHLQRHVDVLGVADLITDRTSADDVENTKPAPDLVEVAMDKVGADSALMIGDAAWDAESALKVGVSTFGVLTGGISEAELLGAGAERVFPGLPELLRVLDTTTLAAPS